MLLSAVGASAGEYFSPIKIAGMLILIVPWLLVTPWIQREAKRITAPQVPWTAGVFGAGALGVLVWLLMPVYLLGMAAYVVLLGGTLAAYVAYHNAQCEEADSLLTASFFAELFGGAKRGVIELRHRARFYSNLGRVILPPSDEDSDEVKKAYNSAQDLLYDMLHRRVSEADITPAGQQTNVRIVIDGVAGASSPLDVSASEAIINYLKEISGMDTEEMRRPQRGKMSVDITGGGRPVEIMLTTAGSTHGQRMQFRMVQEVVQTDINTLGMSEEVTARLNKTAESASGIIIISSRPRNGMTSTLYSLLRKQDAFTKQLVTLESKSVVDLENITQNEYGEPTNLAHALATAIRMDPDVLMIDDCADSETAELIREVSASKLVFLGISGRDPFVALAKWVKVCGSASVAVRNLRGILGQVLLRKLCEECREPYPPDPAMLAKANIPATNIGNFYRKPTQQRVDDKGRPVSCGTCQETGYFGRLGAFEFLEMTDEIKQLITSGADLRQIKAASRKNKMLGLQEQALRKVIAGLTSIKEVIRVTQQTKKRRKKPSGEAKPTDK